MPVLFCVSQGNALVPASKAAAMEMEKLPRKVPLRVEAKQPRNGKFHRLAWAFATYVADALNDGPTGVRWDSSAVMRMFKMAAGEVDPVPVPRSRQKDMGETAYVLRSISFAAMDEQAFGDFMAKAMEFVAAELCPWIRESDHWSEIETILRESGFRPSEAA